VRVGPLWIGPPWEIPPAGVLAILIDPGRAFGTGAHATTRLCLELLVAEQPGSLLDLGCGSGVLAIAAAKLGFEPVIGMDLDPDAVDVTRANARANGVDLDVRLADALADALPSTTLAVANVTAPTVGALGLRLRSPRLVTSGYLSLDDPRPAGFERVRRVELEGWAADLFAQAG